MDKYNRCLTIIVLCACCLFTACAGKTAAVGATDVPSGAFFTAEPSEPSETPEETTVLPSISPAAQPSILPAEAPTVFIPAKTPEARDALSDFYKDAPAGVTEENLPDDTTQLVVVAADGTAAEIYFFERDRGGWAEVTDMEATGFVGTDGVGNLTEYNAFTPEGQFPVGPAFYIGDEIATGLDSFQITDETYWVDDPASKYYNMRVEGTADKDWASAERMAASPVSYKCGFVIGYNLDRVPGAGSAVFFHVGSKPTAGCVATDEDTCLKYLEKLDKNDNPYILIINRSS